MNHNKDQSINKVKVGDNLDEVVLHRELVFGDDGAYLFLEDVVPLDTLKLHLKSLYEIISSKYEDDAI